MKLSRQAIDEFKTIYNDEYGCVLSDDEAQEMALRLLRLFDVLGQTHPGEGSEPTRNP